MAEQHADDNSSSRGVVGHRRTGWVIAAGLLLTFFGLLVWGMTSAFGAAGDADGTADKFWAAFTGPVGDTFGPILSTAAILVTVFVAVWWQPRHNRTEFMERQETSQKEWESR